LHGLKNLWRPSNTRTAKEYRSPVGPNDKNPPKSRLVILMPEMTNIEYEAHAMTQKGNYLNLMKLAVKNS
jgi:hypothetical protein